MTPEGVRDIERSKVVKATRCGLSQEFVTVMIESYGKDYMKAVNIEKEKAATRLIKIARRGKKPERPKATPGEFSFDILMADTDAPGGINRKKAEQALGIVVRLVNPPVKRSPGETARLKRSKKARIANAKDEGYNREKAVSDLKSLGVSTPGYLEFLYGLLDEFAGRYPGISKPAPVHHVLSEIVYLYRYFPGKESRTILSGLVENTETDMHHRLLGLESVSISEGKEAADILIRSLKSGQEEICLLARKLIVSLKHNNPELDLSASLIGILRDSTVSPLTHQEVMAILLKWKDKQLVIAITETMLFFNEESATAAIRALGEFDDPDLVRTESFPTLKEILKNSIPAEHRRWAAISLGRIGIRDAVPILIEALKDREEKVCRAAHGSLRQITKRKFSGKYLIWKNWFENEGKKALSQAAGEEKKSAPESSLMSPRGIGLRKLSRTPIRSTVYRPARANRKNTSSTAALASRSARDKKTGNRGLIYFLLTGILIASVLTGMVFFRKGQGEKKPEKSVRGKYELKGIRLDN